MTGTMILIFISDIISRYLQNKVWVIFLLFSGGGESKFPKHDYEIERTIQWVNFRLYFRPQFTHMSQGQLISVASHCALWSVIPRSDYITLDVYKLRKPIRILMVLINHSVIRCTLTGLQLNFGKKCFMLYQNIDISETH